MIKFQQLTEDRLDELTELERVCFPGDAWSRRMFEQELKNKISCFIIGIDEESDKLICYGCMWIVADIAEITNIAVAPEYRRGGVGEKLLSLLIGISHENGADEIDLEVKDKNTPARSLYEKLGFERVGLRRNYYEDGCDAILMTMEL